MSAEDPQTRWETPAAERLGSATELKVVGPGAGNPDEGRALGHGPRPVLRIAVLTFVSLLMLLLAILIPSGLLQQGSGTWTVPQFIDQFMTNVRDFAATLAQTGAAGVFSRVVCSYVAAFVAGAALGGCGAVFQGSFRNPLASPSTIGVVSGCLLGAVVFALVFEADRVGVTSGMSASEIMALYESTGPLEYAWTMYGRALFAMIGGMLVVATALFVSRVMGGGGLNNVVLVVIGQVFALVITSVCDTLRYFYERSGDYERGDLVQMAQAVPFNAFFDFGDLAWFTLPLIAGLVVLVLCRTRLNLLVYPDADARAMGVDIDRFRTCVIVLCTALTSLVVGFCGPVVFVGFVCPHVARRIVGPNYRYLLPASLVVGAAFLVLVLYIVNLFSIDAYQGVNLVATIVGCIAFLIVAFRGRGGAYAWK